MSRATLPSAPSWLAASALPKLSDPIRRVPSKDLFGAARELLIQHAGREYRLRITQNGKLILTA